MFSDILTLSKQFISHLIQVDGFDNWEKDKLINYNNTFTNIKIVIKGKQINNNDVFAK